MFPSPFPPPGRRPGAANWNRKSLKLVEILFGDRKVTEKEKMKFRRGDQRNRVGDQSHAADRTWFFLLLIFFMVTTSFQSRETGWKSICPRPTRKTPEAPSDRIDVVVDQDGNYLVKRRGIGQ